ncbi:MAG: hypothetical protein HPY57_13445 [Ignavibacteria bacterium]|nr:hypothetical protein [Ignavibacteria bacterium]
MAKENFKELEKDIVEFFIERLNTFNIPIDLKFYFQSNCKQKQLIKLTKIPDQYSVIMNKDILVQVNEEYFDAFSTEDEDINKILFDQCIDLIEYDLDKGTFKIGKANFYATEGIIEKYTYDKVQRAVEVERLYEDQKKNQE